MACRYIGSILSCSQDRPLSPAQYTSAHTLSSSSNHARRSSYVHHSYYPVELQLEALHYFVGYSISSADFYGKSAEEADDFIQAIHKIARDSGRSRDPEWMADLANVAFKGNARRWFNTLTFEQKHDWEKLEEALLQKYSPSDPATNPSNPISNPNTNPWNPISGPDINNQNPISVPNTNPWDPNANSPKPNTNPPWNPISGPNTNPSNPLSGSGNYPVNSNPTSDSSPR